MVSSQNLKQVFDRGYDAYISSKDKGLDPLFAIDRRLSPADFELLSFVVAGISYGRVEQIYRSTDSLLKRLSNVGISASGSGLRKYLLSLDTSSLRDLRSALKGWSHRMNTASDLEEVLVCLSKALGQSGSLAKVFQKNYVPCAKMQVIGFSESLRELKSSRASRLSTKNKWAGTGLEWFASSPASKSTCKRLMMWLRWMIRKDEIDPGTWQEAILLDKSLERPCTSRLFCPIDTHVFQWARRQGIVNNLSPSWKSVEEITNYFKKVCPEDPVRYDFAICHESMLEFRGKKKQVPELSA